MNRCINIIWLLFVVERMYDVMFPTLSSAHHSSSIFFSLTYLLRHTPASHESELIRLAYTNLILIPPPLGPQMVKAVWLRNTEY